MTQEEALYYVDTIEKDARSRFRKSETYANRLDIELAQSYRKTIMGLANGYVFPKLAESIERFADKVFA